MLTSEVKLDQLLKSTSRAFYLSLRILPKQVRKPISLAYLMARAADTITDTPNISALVKIKSLDAIKLGLSNDKTDLNFTSLSENNASQTLTELENQLVKAIPIILTCIQSLNSTDYIQVKNVVLTLIQGMEMDLRYFSDPINKSGILSLTNSDELDQYTYLVAGCVGPFWTELSFANESKLKNTDVSFMSSLGIDFGKALQMTNILRDCPSDIRLGKCYIPDEDLNELKLSHSDLLNPIHTKAVKQLLANQIDKTLNLYQSAERYVLSIPATKMRLRLAVLWPLLLGLGTLNALALKETWIQSDSVAKVSRFWVYKMMLKSLFFVTSDYLIKYWIEQLRDSITQHLKT